MVDVIFIAGIAQCPQQIILNEGQDFFPPAFVNKSILPTCLSCFSTFGTPSRDLSFCEINGERFPFNTEVVRSGNQVFITNFNSLPLLMDGRNNEVLCRSTRRKNYERVLITLSEQCKIL